MEVINNFIGTVYSRFDISEENRVEKDSEGA